MNKGDYVRTEYGITKIEKVTLPEEPSDCLFVKFENEPYSFKYKPWETIDFKSSPNIIDLIEVGDYVDGCPVRYINYDLDKEEDIVESITIFNSFQETKDILFEKDIKSIITKEQFESIQYKVGE